MRDRSPEELLQQQVERLYAKAKAGRWEEVWAALAGETVLAGTCARYAKASSGWGFLHQAAYAGNEVAVRGLIRLGASLAAQSKELETARDVARRRGHAALADLLGRAEAGAGDLWRPPQNPLLLPSSCAWDNRAERRAWRELRVGYAGGCVVIKPGDRFFVDGFDRVIVGWHGSYDPPSGMEGEPMG